MAGRIDSLAWEGTLSSTDFHNAASAFVRRWKSINFPYPPWSWIPSSQRPWIDSDNTEGYLALENICLLSTRSEVQEEKNKGNLSHNVEEPSDNATLVQMDHQGVHYFDFHIAYCDSFKVPVLYFRAYYGDGQLLAFDETEKILTSHSKKLLEASKWTFITQEEHPYLHRPWFKLHPCGTSEWMKLLFLEDTSLVKKGVIELYLVSWLSVVGQVVGLRVPLNMLKDHNQAICNGDYSFCVDSKP